LIRQKWNKLTKEDFNDFEDRANALKDACSSLPKELVEDFLKIKEHNLNRHTTFNEGCPLCKEKNKGKSGKQSKLILKQPKQDALLKSPTFEMFGNGSFMPQCQQQKEPKNQQ
jgi:hypothetical protein